MERQDLENGPAVFYFVPSNSIPVESVSSSLKWKFMPYQRVSKASVMWILYSSGSSVESEVDSDGEAARITLEGEVYALVLPVVAGRLADEDHLDLLVAVDEGPVDDIAYSVLANHFAGSK